VRPVTKPDSRLVEASAAFEAELAVYTRLGELFIKTPLASVKHLERANATLADIAACEERLQTAGQNLVLALGTARQAQEDLAKQVSRTSRRAGAQQDAAELMGELAGVADEWVGSTRITARSGNGDSEAGPTTADAHDLSTTILISRCVPSSSRSARARPSA
jgi:hypothetical protein